MIDGIGVFADWVRIALFFLETTIDLRDGGLYDGAAILSQTTNKSRPVRVSLFAWLELESKRFVNHPKETKSDKDCKTKTLALDRGNLGCASCCGICISTAFDWLCHYVAHHAAQSI